MTQIHLSEPQIYEGQFGNFTITQSDRTGVMIYRGGLLVGALSFAIGSLLVLSQGDTPTVLAVLTPLCLILHRFGC